MGSVRIYRLLTATILSLAATAPALAQSHAVQPQPYAIQRPDRRNTVQMPPPAAYRQPSQRESTPRRRGAAPELREAAPAPAPQRQVPAAVPITETVGPGIKAMLDKLLAASDSQIAEKLRAAITSKNFARTITRPAERGAIEAHYAGRSYAPLWIKDGRLTANAKTVIARLQHAASEGLDAADYPVPEFGSLTGADSLADGDVKLTYSVLIFARHLQSGRIAPRRVVAEVDYGDHTPNPADVLKALADAGDVNATLDDFNPPHQGFRTLKSKLAALTAMASSGETEDRIADGPTIKYGVKDPRVPLLRQRLGVRGKADDTLFDKKLAYAVKLTQQQVGLSPTGRVDGKTLAAINGPKLSRQAEIVAANMERWRWLPRDLGKTSVIVNIPDFSLKVMRGDDIVWRTKIVAGKPQTQTPLTSGPMHDVIVNPSWYVPQSIIQNELLPLYQSDPQIFDRLGLEVKRGPDGHINVVQPPGAANALGRIKFAFHNKYQVYLHDTPEKRLFSRPQRAYSHGCMRVENPTKFGEVILALALGGPAPSARQINAMFGQEERKFKLVNQPTVHLTYQTAFVDDAGKLVIRPDIYHFDSRIRAILTTAERKVADTAPPVDPKQDLAALKNNQEILRRVERREAANPFLLFERLFR